MSAKSPDHIDVAVGQRIRIQRLTAGLSQTELAEELGVTFQQVQKYEKGVNRVGAGRLNKIAQVLGVPVSTFFGTDDAFVAEHAEGSSSQSPLTLLTVPGALRLMRAFAQLKDGKLRRSIVEAIENIVAGRR